MNKLQKRELRRDVFYRDRTSYGANVTIYVPNGREYLDLMEVVGREPLRLHREAINMFVTVDDQPVDDYVLETLSVDDTIMIVEVVNLLLFPTPQR